MPCLRWAATGVLSSRCQVPATAWMLDVSAGKVGRVTNTMTTGLADSMHEMGAAFEVGCFPGTFRAESNGSSNCVAVPAGKVGKVTNSPPPPNFFSERGAAFAVACPIGTFRSLDQYAWAIQSVWLGLAAQMEVRRARHVRLVHTSRHQVVCRARCALPALLRLLDPLPRPLACARPTTTAMPQAAHALLALVEALSLPKHLRLPQ